MSAKRFFIFGVILVVALFLFWKIASKPGQNQVAQTSQPISEVSNQVELLPALDGEMVKPEVAQNRPIAVMVENYPDSRPQSGLDRADLVYEAPTEGGITRFMAVYQTTGPENIGPVRSARVYFLDFANELGAVYAHVGGNSDALENIRKGLYPNIFDADQFFLDSFFHRVKSRLMPHNVYTSYQKLDLFLKTRNNFVAYTPHPWLFKDDQATSSPTQTINVDFSQAEYAVAWKYDPANNSYLRFLANRPHKDADSGVQISAKNIVVQFVETFPTKTDTLFSIGMTLTGQGRAFIFLDGKVIRGIWKKQDGKTRYYDAENNEIQFNRGATWVELVPKEKEAFLKWK